MRNDGYSSCLVCLSVCLSAHAILSAATVSDLVGIIRIFNLEICNRTDFCNYRSSSDFARAHVL